MRNNSVIALVSALILVASTSVALAAKSDKKFMKDAIQGNNSEVQLGELAQQNGAAQEMRNFGKTLSDDHAAANEKAVPIARSMDINPPTTMTAEAQNEKLKLEKLSGDAFDREFANYMVKDHKNDIQEFQRQANGSGEVANFAQENLPTLKKHLEIAQSLSTANSAHQ